MKALRWYGKHDVRVESVSNPKSSISTMLSLELRQQRFVAPTYTSIMA